MYANPGLGFRQTHPEDRGKLEALREPGRADTCALTMRWMRKDGEVIWVDQRTVPIFERGELVAIETIARDVAEIK